MEYTEDLLISNHANIMADLAYERNLEKHLGYLNVLLMEVGITIDKLLLEGKDVTGLQELGYNSYRMRDEILRILRPDDLDNIPTKEDLS